MRQSPPRGRARKGPRGFARVLDAPLSAPPAGDGAAPKPHRSPPQSIPFSPAGRPGAARPPSLLPLSPSLQTFSADVKLYLHHRIFSAALWERFIEKSRSSEPQSGLPSWSEVPPAGRPGSTRRESRGRRSDTGGMLESPWLLLCPRSPGSPREWRRGREGFCRAASSAEQALAPRLPAFLSDNFFPIKQPL